MIRTILGTRILAIALIPGWAMVEVARIVDIAISSRIVARVVSNAPAINSATIVDLTWRIQIRLVRLLLEEECSGRYLLLMHPRDRSSFLARDQSCDQNKHYCSRSHYGNSVDPACR